MTASAHRLVRVFAAFVAALALVLVALPAGARVPGPPELERLLAPVALYPDPLLAQVLVAATRPGELAQAAQWSAAHPGWEGEAAVRAVEPRGWDPAVRALVAFPPLLARLAAQPAWLEELGVAFALHEPQVMDAVQALRRRARAAGTLESAIVVQPAGPGTLYVPWYDPLAVYGPWPWHAHPPVVWARWPRSYARHRHPAPVVHHRAPVVHHSVPRAARHPAPVVRQAAPILLPAAPAARVVVPAARVERRGAHAHRHADRDASRRAPIAPPRHPHRNAGHSETRAR